MSPNPTAPIGSATGKGLRPPLDQKYVRDTIESHALRLKRLEANRDPRPLRLGQLADTGYFTQAPAGHTPTYDINTGELIPSPNLAILTFNMIGTVAPGFSPTHWSRYSTRIVGISACLGTGGTGSVDFDLYLNGSPVLSIVGVSVGPAHIAVSPTIELPSYEALQVNITSGGGGNKDLVIQVELGSDVAGQPGPVPFGG